MIIDALTHITKDGSWFKTPHDASLDRLLTEMKKANVNKALLVGNPELKDQKTLLEASERYPDAFFLIAGLDLAQASIQDVEKQISSYKKQGFLGIKIHPRFSKIRLDSEIMSHTLKLAEKYQMTVLLCTILKSPAPIHNRPLPDMIQEMCENHQDAKIILVHGGYTKILAVSEVIRPFENIFLDLSCTLTRFYDSSVGADIKFLLRTFDKRICFGSDFPEFTYSNVIDALEYLGQSRNDLEKRGVLGDNLLQFLNQK